LQEHLRVEGAQVCLIEGSRGSGKTRLALEVLLPWRRNALVIIPGSDVRPSILSELECSSACVVLLEEPEPSFVEAWVKAALGSRETKLVITTKSPEDITLGYLVADDRVLRYRIRPFSETAGWAAYRKRGQASDRPALSALPSLLSAYAEIVADLSQRLELTDRNRDRNLSIFADLEIDLGPKSVELFGEILEGSIKRPSSTTEALVARLLERYREKLAKDVVSKLESYLKPQEPAP
jgi:hypothetical protein